MYQDIRKYMLDNNKKISWDEVDSGYEFFTIRDGEEFSGFSLPGGRRALVFLKLEIMKIGNRPMWGKLRIDLEPGDYDRDLYEKKLGNFSIDEYRIPEHVRNAQKEPAFYIMEA